MGDIGGFIDSERNFIPGARGAAPYPKVTVLKIGASFCPFHEGSR
jgi:hypothetical protein